MEAFSIGIIMIPNKKDKIWMISIYGYNAKYIGGDYLVSALFEEIIPKTW